MGANPRILIVDDNEHTVKAIQRVLERHGFDVLVATDGSTGLKMSESAQPDLVILDILMPGLNGYEVCRRLHAYSGTAHIPVLMLSGKGQLSRRGEEFVKSIGERVEGYDAGAVEFLSKPVGIKELVARVKGLLWACGIEA